MSSLKEIRTRIHSVDNIKKITKTMEMVAASQLRKAQLKAEQSRPYTKKLKQVLDHVISSDITHPLQGKNNRVDPPTASKRHRSKQAQIKAPLEVVQANKIGVIIVGSDRGLCGSYNTNIFSKTDKFLKQYDTDLIELIPVGRKIIEHYQREKWLVKQTVANWAKLSLHDVRLLANQLINLYLSNNYDEIWLVYTHYINVLVRNVIIEKFLPFEQPLEKRNAPQLNYIFEPSPEVIFNEILPRYCMIKVQNVLYEAYASELAARILSMKTASSNAHDMIEELTLQRNKIRQAAITREIAEITSGAENLK